MAWQIAGPFCFLIDCWQFEGGLIAAGGEIHPATLNYNTV
jgi:hypothetical protein